MRAARGEIDAGLESFTAAPLTADESARRAQQLLRFLALVPVEYDRGVSGTQVTLDFEIQEAVAFHTGAQAAMADLQDQLAKRDPARAGAAARDLDALGAMVGPGHARKEGVPEAEAVQARTDAIEGALDARCPSAGRRRRTSRTTT